MLNLVCGRFGLNALHLSTKLASIQTHTYQDTSAHDMEESASSYLFELNIIPDPKFAIRKRNDYEMVLLVHSPFAVPCRAAFGDVDSMALTYRIYIQNFSVGHV